MAIDDIIENDIIKFGKNLGLKTGTDSRGQRYVLLPLDNINGKIFGLGVNGKKEPRVYFVRNMVLHWGGYITCYHHNAISEVLEHNGVQYIVKVNENEQLVGNSKALILSYLNKDIGGLRPSLFEVVYRKLAEFPTTSLYELGEFLGQKIMQFEEQLNDLEKMDNLPGTDLMKRYILFEATKYITASVSVMNDLGPEMDIAKLEQTNKKIIKLICCNKIIEGKEILVKLGNLPQYKLDIINEICSNGFTGATDLLEKMYKTGNIEARSQTIEAIGYNQFWTGKGLLEKIMTEGDDDLKESAKKTLRRLGRAKMQDDVFNNIQETLKV